MKIENKEMLLYCMNRAYKELYTVMERDSYNPQDVYYALGNSIHWICDCYDRVKEIVSKEDKEIIRAVLAANNCQKHMKELWQLHKAINSGYPRNYPRSYGIKYTWISIEHIPLRHNNEKAAYKKYFLGNNILSCLLRVKELIEKYYEWSD